MDDVFGGQRQFYLRNSMTMEILPLEGQGWQAQVPIHRFVVVSFEGQTYIVHSLAESLRVCVWPFYATLVLAGEP